MFEYYYTVNVIKIRFIVYSNKFNHSRIEQIYKFKSQMLEYILNDRLVVTYIIPYFWLICSPVVLISEIILGYRAPYGRYNTSNNGIPARLAWFIQELPSFTIPCYLLYYHWSSVTITKFIIVGLYLIHYFQR
jgi:hypothetical protein